jgi:hypothetical protein
MCLSFHGYSQETRFRDTLVLNDNSFEEIIYYSARDSIYTDLKNKQVHLYGDAKVENADIQMSAGYILIDLNKNEVFATYAVSKDSLKVEYPKFSDGAEDIQASSIRYNFDTEKGYIEELAIQQGEAYLYMGIAKRQANDEIHFKQGRFTTCDLEEPHYHFQLSKAVMIPEKRIVTGPMNLWVKGVPTPLGLPFSVIPQQKERTHGILFPELVPTSIYGFGVQNLGYYFPINDRLQTSAYVNLYSRGSWGVSNKLEYTKKYGYQGILDLGFQQFRATFPNNQAQNKVSVTWIHNKIAKSNPFWVFSSNVNFISDNNSKNNLDPLNSQYFNNSFNSDVNVNRLFPSKPISMGLKLSVRQNSIQKNIALSAPIYNFNLTRVFPFKNVVNPLTKNELSKMLSRLGVAYGMEVQNKAQLDSISQQQGTDAMLAKFQNGYSQNIVIQTTGGFFKNSLKFTPSVTYANKLNFQQIQKSYDAITNSTSTDTIQKVGLIHELNFNAQFTTMLYSYYRFIGKRDSKLRHVLTPSFGYRYVPQLNSLITDSIGLNQAPVSYSPFERSLYTASSAKTASMLTFAFNNTFELKQKSEKDTITGYRKLRLIDQFSLNGNYDFMKDSMNLSDISLNLRISPLQWLNFVANSSFSPYSWIDSTGKTTGDYAVLDNKGLGRFMTANFTTTLTITSKEGREELQKTKEIVANNWNADYNYFALHPEYLLNFTIPWKLSLSHVYGLFANQIKTDLNDVDYRSIHTLMATGDLSFTKRWKIASTTNIDLDTKRITNTRLTLSRNMHCWALSFNWTPIGNNKSFLLAIRNTSSMFQSAKIEIRKPPVFL